MKKYSIRRAYFLSFIFLALVGIVFIAVLSSIFYRSSTNNIIEERIKYLEALANTIGSPFWVHQELLHIPGTIENFMKQMSKTSDIMFIRIIDTETATVKKSADQKEVGMKIENMPIFKEKASVRDGSFNNEPIKELSLKSKSGDNLWMGVSLKLFKRNMIIAVIFLAEGILVLFGVASLIVFLISEYFVIGPLETLKNAFSKLQKRDYDIDLGNISGVEMQEVFKSFNQMLQELKASQEKLKKSNWAQVKKIEDRIKELEDEVRETEKARNNLEEKLKEYM
ncbi:MAG: hypothetical protein A3A94_00560 [Candidatus Portnoybacteria bacterium RIFCSPLOWO2_01_FULL_43_11]|uniref:histidine kinase n=3 Tax=Candidatus Portnoyibacteriota TaxID=1817913 RepID=A0A1G2FBY1_9BACT|nr:MAG: hypothetical protein A2815_02150 [Candidatus Portnoybacteria bacterium RIFCSPHIGHO2_01_FULL_40_12b]OGZ36980.1 MAG: hypothetical protein A3D38_00680 [Candidatus Portnoybacteria bacterium RIFCSPHIGHO2_02_FULL_40_23]OGZ38337.1 MAG: hypothetical protein A3A94_00560 [Candidatus Portnoybacteria bacterium RIFCSPLOWO2_01_FULL_43_11]OGZ41191.1 MAG: hypothetical protein A3I20_02605 [Candidatus Portnoybacteria bacterium RIFCSPLOWO2_02_FULL_40_15]